MSKLLNCVIFLLGAAVGTTAARQYFKHKYGQIAQTEIDSVKETFSKRETNLTEENDNNAKSKAKMAKERSSVTAYASMLHGQGYKDYSDNGFDIKKENVMDADRPYVISPDEFGELDAYEQISLTYYADHILADDNDDLVEDVDNIVGIESLGYFGGYEEDSVFVRNVRLKCDYEILVDQRKYSDIIKKRPRKPHEVD